MASGLATRCTACGTVFRVVPDQLRVSEGWVRCGRCSEVFNAAEHLLEMPGNTQRQPDEMPSALPPPAPQFTPQFTQHSAPQFTPQVAEATYLAPYDEPDQAPHDAPPLYTHDEPAYTPLHAPAGAEDSRFDHSGEHVDHGEHAFAVTRQELPPAPVADSTPPFDMHESDVQISTAGSRAADLDDLRATRSEPSPDSADVTPSFLRRAERAQRWRQPRVRVALWSLVLLAGLGLAAQVVFTYRDLAAARFVALRPALELACGWLACSVGDAHAIDSLVVESSGLVRVEKSSVYKFSVALRNRAGIAVAVPAVELALTDAQGKLLARRVLRATDLGASQTALAAGRDLALQATLQAVTDPVAGYTIELFYP